MTEKEEAILEEWIGSLKNLNVRVKKMFGCYCLYCDDQAVGWLHDSVLSLHEVGLEYLPEKIKRSNKNDKINEIVIPIDYAKEEWLSRAVQDTAIIRKRKKEKQILKST